MWIISYVLSVRQSEYTLEELLQSSDSLLALWPPSSYCGCWDRGQSHWQHWSHMNRRKVILAMVRSMLADLQHVEDTQSCAGHCRHQWLAWYSRAFRLRDLLLSWGLPRSSSHRAWMSLPDHTRRSTDFSLNELELITSSNISHFAGCCFTA